MELASLYQGQLLVFFVVIVPLAIIHEYSHGWMAHFFGDPTAKYAGRLTLNPLAHIDVWGTVLMPIILLLISQGQFTFAYAKPVPVNPMYLRGRYAGQLVALAGPFANFLTAAILGLILRLSPWESFNSILSIFVFYSILLGVFNLVPIPPLDGSKVLFPLLPESWLPVRLFLEQFGFIILLMFLLAGFHWLFPVIAAVYQLFVGMPLML